MSNGIEDGISTVERARFFETNAERDMFAAAKLLVFFSSPANIQHCTRASYSFIDCVNMLMTM